MQTSGNEGGALAHTNLGEDGGTSSHLSDGAARRHSQEPGFLAGLTYTHSAKAGAVEEEPNERYAG